MTSRNRNRLLAGLVFMTGLAAAALWLRDAADVAVPAAGTSAAVQSTGRTSSPQTAVAGPATATAQRKAAATRVVVGSEPLPPADAPLAQTFAGLRARADAGDAAAATRLYRDVGRCLHAHDVLTNQARAASWMLEDDVSRLDATQLERRERRLGSIEDELAKARENGALCDGVTPEQLQLAPAALRAAQLGDTQAADCYVNAGLTTGGGLLDHPEWLQQYKDNALPLANAAVRQGDWTMVGQLQRAYAQSNGAGLLGQVTGADPAQAYAYLKLRSLGAVTSQGSSFFTRQLADAAQNLPPDAVAQGDTWARSTYQEYFGAHPQIDAPHNFNPCQNIGG